MNLLRTQISNICKCVLREECGNLRHASKGEENPYILLQLLTSILVYFYIRN